MVADISEVSSVTPQSKNPKIISIDNTLIRPTLLKDNGISPKNPKSRQVASRYLSPSPSYSLVFTPSSSSYSSRRSPSPLVSRISTTIAGTPSVLPKRSVSVDRRRPFRADLDTKLGNVDEVSAATKQLVTCTRRLSVSFQGEAFSLPVSKTKVTPASPNLSYVRKGVLEKRRGNNTLRGKGDGGGERVDNLKSIEQHMWPARRRTENCLSRGLDCSNENDGALIGSGNVIWALQKSVNGETRRLSVDGRISLDLGDGEVTEMNEQGVDVNSVSESSGPSDRTTSDTDSVSSSSTSGVQECNGVSVRQSGPRGFLSAKFWQETDSRLRKLQDPSSTLLMSPVSKAVLPIKIIQSKKFPSDSPLSSPCRTASPIRGGNRHASPSKLMASIVSSSARGIISPSRSRNLISEIFNFSETPSVLSFAVDVQRGKVGENRLFEAHLLRLLHNRQLLWLFVNARTEATLLVQKHGAEKNLWNAWITISDLRDSVTKKRYRLQLLKKKLKLASILKGQVTYLEGWASFDKDHCVSLLGAIEALKASTLRLPVTGATAEVQSMKEAINSAFHVMHAMASSTCSLLSKVEEMNTLLAELTKVTRKERALLEHIQNIMSILAILQVKHCSLRSHMLQNNHSSLC